MNNNYCTFKLYNSLQIPCLAIGFYQISDKNELKNIIRNAFKVGIRHFDSAAAYNNESILGEVLRELKINREEIFISSKVRNEDQGYESTIKAYNKTINDLGVQYLDQYLIHWAVKDRFFETWKAMEYLYISKKVKAIGVSNFLVHHLQYLFDNSDIKPMVNQIEHHPYLTSPELVHFCKKNKIIVEAYSALMRGQFNNIKVLSDLSKKYNKTKSQILLRWNIQKNIIPIFKSATLKRITENSNLFDFSINNDDMLLLDLLNKNKRLEPSSDPDNIVLD